MIDNVVEVISLCKSYSDKIALQEVSLMIPRGSLSAIIGRNGAGKSTLLNCIAGLTHFDQGVIRILLDHHRVEIEPGSAEIGRALRKKIGSVFQEPSLWPHMTVLENVMRPLVDIHDYNRKEAEEKAREWLNSHLKVRVSDLGEFPENLSGGQQKRVSLARTFAIDPDLLLIDEIETSLDPEATENVLRIIEKNFIQDPSKTVLMVTHRIDFLTRCSSNVIVLDDGRLIEQGAPNKVLWEPSEQTLSLIQGAIDPSRSQWSFLYRCLRSSIRITSLTLSQTEEKSIFQQLAFEVLRLISQLEPETPHQVLIVTRDSEGPWRLSIRGACKSEDFILDGKDVQSLNSIVEPDVARVCGKSEQIEQYRFVENYERLLANPGGVLFDPGNEMSGGSLIAMMMRRQLGYDYAETFGHIPGPYHVRIPPKDPAVTFYEFSKKTGNVYLFPMEWEGSVVGVLSIDTYAQEKWIPPVVEELLLIANLGALAIKIHRSAKPCNNPGQPE